jgi:cyanophycin synthetase
MRRYQSMLRSALDRKSRQLGYRFADLRDAFYRDYWEQAAREADCTVDDLGFGYLRIRRGDTWTAVRHYGVMLDDHLTLNMAGNKLLSQRMLADAGYAVPRLMRFEPGNLDDALNFMAEVGGTVVVKPSAGTGAGRGITTKIDNRAALRRAAQRALAYSPQLLIEEHVQGASFRLLYLHGELIDAVRRDPPELIGDGRSSISRLVDEENRLRLQTRPIRALSPLTVDMECRLKLTQQNLKASSVPEINTRIVLKDVVNQNSAAQNHVVRDQVDPRFRRFGQEIARLFKIELLGLDIIAEDIARPLAESGGVINEINTTPGLHHHYLVSEPSERAPVGPLLLESLLGATAGSRLRMESV